MLPLFLRRSAVAIAIAAIVPLVALAGLPAPASGPTSHASPPSGERSIAPSGGGNSAVAAGPPALPTGGAPDERSARAEVLSELAKAHVPDRFAFLPNFGLAPPRPGSVATPGYRYSPAPVGVAAYGVNNTTGTPTAALLNTASFEGSTTFDQLSAFYLDDDSPWYVGEQLNAVLSNVTLFGNDSYAFWTQNVVEYSAQDGLLQFIDNIWNFSSPATRISSNVFNSTGPNGSLLAPTFYYGLGPVINISMPFTLNLYLNATTTPVGGFPDDAVWFNYSLVKNGSLVDAGTYDWVVFNSQPSTPQATLAPIAFQLNGAHPTPTGFLPWDAELVLSGPGGGSTTSILDLAAEMTLSYLNASLGRYAVVPDAWNVGSETGETIEGAATWFDPGHTVHLGAGPGLPTPMWGDSATAAPGFLQVNATVAPANAFVFVNAGSTLNPPVAAWAPVPPDGHATYQLPVGNYSGIAELSDYAPTAFEINVSNRSTWDPTLGLAFDPSTGIYTPLVAWGDSQLAAISRSGTGTASNPFILWNNQVAPLGPEFGELNDFGFAVFPGLLLAETSDHVDVIDPPSFLLAYGGPELAATAGQGLPSTNDLQLELFWADNVSIWGASEITGWFPSSLVGFPVANLMLWNSSNDLIADDVFASEGSSLLVYDGTNNVVWGNWFEWTAMPAGVAGSSGPIGLQMFSSGNTIYNNFFTAPIPALSPPFTIYVETFYGSDAAIWVNAWNVTPRPAWQPSVVNGFTLAGSIVGGATQGGNYWWNYGRPSNPLGSLPYDDSGSIAFGGDFEPLGTLGGAAAATLTFEAAGSFPGAVWSVSVNGYSQTNDSLALVFPVTNGTYQYAVGLPPGWTASPLSGSLTVAGKSVVVVVTWTPLAPPPTYAVTLQEDGLPFGTGWTITFAGVAHRSNASSVVVSVTAGTYRFDVAPVAGFTAAPSSGNLSVFSSGLVLRITFTGVNGTIDVTLVSEPLGLIATLDGVPVTVSPAGFSVPAPPGIHEIALEAPGYYPYIDNVSVPAGKTVSLTVALHPVSGPSSTQPSGAFPPAAWDVIGLMVALVAVLGIALAVVGSRRAPPPPGPERPDRVDAPEDPARP